MLNKKISFTSAILAIIIVSAVVGLGIHLVAAWTGPSALPPSGNVAAPINTSSTAQTKDGNLTIGSGYLYLRSQLFFGDNSSALNYYSNHDTVAQMLFRDKQGTIYGRVYGSRDGANFGMLDGDAEWALLMAKDNYTSLRIDNVEKLRIDTDSLNLGSKETITFYDTWLRLNNTNAFSSGIFTPGNLNIYGSISDGGGNLTLDDNVDITGNLNVSGTITGGDTSSGGIVWKSSPSTFSPTCDSTWRNLDVTSLTSANAKAVIISINGSGGRWMRFYTRRNGSSANFEGVAKQGILDSTGQWGSNQDFGSMIIQGVDSGQVLQYWCWREGTYTWQIVGYFE